MLFLGVLLPYGSKAQVSVKDLWSDEIPGSIMNGNYIEKATGTAVLICPGGGYSVLAFDHEGHAIARWLNDNGIAGIILKYRLPSEIHIFQRGGHGYGLASGQETQSAWPELCIRWLKASGF